MADQFRVSEDLFDEEVADALPESGVAIDAERPGFASLLTVLEAAREDQVPKEVQVLYHDALFAHLRESLAQIDTLEVPKEVADVVAPTIAATRGLLNDMDRVLSFFAAWLDRGEPQGLDDAIALLESIHREIRTVT